MARAAEISERYRRFAEIECKGYSDAYYRLASEVADDEMIVDFLSGMPVTQPNLLFASAQFLTAPGSMPSTAGDLRELLEKRADEIAVLMRTRRTQTNEVGRCATLLPAIPQEAPVAILEVGSSAGLCLMLDRFHYQYGNDCLGDASSPVHLTCNVAGARALPTALPHVVWRHGLDRNPLDVREEDSANWLLACVWPDHPERRQRLQAAIALAKAEPPPQSQGDLVDDLPALLATVPDDAQLVVFHSAALTYVAPERRTAFASALAKASEHRDILWLSNEAPGVIPEIAVLAPPVPQFRFLLGSTRLRHGGRTDALLGLAHPHGAEITWL